MGAIVPFTILRLVPSLYMPRKRDTSLLLRDSYPETQSKDFISGWSPGNILSQKFGIPPGYHPLTKQPVDSEYEKERPHPPPPVPPPSFGALHRYAVRSLHRCAPFETGAMPNNLHVRTDAERHSSLPSRWYSAGLGSHVHSDML